MRFLFGLVLRGEKVTLRFFFFNENDPIERNIADAGERGELLEQYSSVEEGDGFSTKWKCWPSRSRNSSSVRTGEKRIRSVHSMRIFSICFLSVLFSLSRIEAAISSELARESALVV